MLRITDCQRPESADAPGPLPDANRAFWSAVSDALCLKLSRSRRSGGFWATSGQEYSRFWSLLIHSNPQSPLGNRRQFRLREERPDSAERRSR